MEFLTKPRYTLRREIETLAKRDTPYREICAAQKKQRLLTILLPPFSQGRLFAKRKPRDIVWLK